MISKRAQSVAPSATLAISAKAKDLKRQGKSIVSLSAGEPDFNTPDHICDAAIQAIRDGFHGYTMNTGTPELRESRSEEHTSELQSRFDLVCRLLLDKKELY